MKLNLVNLMLTASGLAVAATSATPAFAQESEPQQGGIQEIVVEARKRQESVQDVPVAVTALSEEMIANQDLTSIEKVAARTPNFNVGRASNGSGAQLTLRGIGSSSTSIGIEQSVAVVVDGAYYGQGRIINEGFFDLARMELLKGPQALFFGKNATAGVVSITTADPGDELEVIGRVAYELESKELQGEAIFSTPITDSIGMRLAVRATKQYDGYYTNESVNRTYSTFDIATATTTPHTSYPAATQAPGNKEILARGTLKFDNGGPLTATIKGSFDRSEVNNSSWNYVAFNCPTGFSALTGYACNRDFVTHQNNIPLDIAANFPFSKSDGALYNKYKSAAVTGNIVYDLGNAELTSVTNYNWNNNRWACACDFQSSDAGTWATENSSWKSFSQELRLLTDLDGPFNFMLGGLYQDTRRDFDQYVMFANLEDSSVSATNRYLATTKTSYTDGKTYAIFGQLIFNVTPDVELSAGGRYTHETKDSYFTQPYNNAALTGIFRDQNDTDGLGEVYAKQKFNNFSPEATISWKPNQDVMLYAAYKTAYKSGGFSNGGINSKFSTNPFDDLTFDEEKAKGFELGIKSTVADNQLRLNFSYFNYKYTDLQVDFFNSPIFAFQTLTADARTQGIEAEFEFVPYAAQGLNIHGSFNYNKARYTNFPAAPCYAGQSLSEGCNVLVGGAYRQNLNGQALSVAPEITSTFGVSYDTDLSDSLKMGISADAKYSSDYIASAFGNGDSKQNEYVSIDAGVRIGATNDSWELALLGKNLTNQFYVTGVVDGPSTGGASGGLTPAHADQLGFGSLPRTVQLRLTVKY